MTRQGSQNAPCDYRSTLYTLVKRIVHRCGYSLSEMSIGLGYDNPTTVHTILSRSNQKNASPCRYRALLSLRELGATPEELVAIFAEYIAETGDASLLLDIDERIRKRAARRIAEELECGGLFLPPRSEKRMINIKRIQLRREEAKQKQHEGLLKMLAARGIQLKKKPEESQDAA